MPRAKRIGRSIALALSLGVFLGGCGSSKAGGSSPASSAAVASDSAALRACVGTFNSPANSRFQGYVRGEQQAGYSSYVNVDVSDGPCVVSLGQSFNDSGELFLQLTTNRVPVQPVVPTSAVPETLAVVPKADVIQPAAAPSDWNAAPKADGTIALKADAGQPQTAPPPTQATSPPVAPPTQLPPNVQIVAAVYCDANAKCFDARAGHPVNQAPSGDDARLGCRWTDTGYSKGLGVTKYFCVK